MLPKQAAELAPMLTRLETVVNQRHAFMPPAGSTRLRSLSLNCVGDGEKGSPFTTFLQASVAMLPVCLTTLRLAMWTTHTQANLSMLTQLKVSLCF